MSAAADARADRIRRHGSGARHDDPAAPADELAWARLGTAYFARKLNGLSDVALTASCLGSPRASRIVAEVSYEARALAQILEWARIGTDASEIDPFGRIIGDVELATTLPAGAVRNLFRHSEVHLNVEWRDLGADAWDAVIRLPGGRIVRIRETARIRAFSIWLQAVQLDDAGSFSDFPVALIDAMLAEAASTWTHDASFVLRPDDRPAAVRLGRGGRPQEIRGSATDIASWLAGRPARRLSSDGPIAACPAPLRPFDLEREG